MDTLEIQEKIDELLLSGSDVNINLAIELAKSKGMDDYINQYKEFAKKMRTTVYGLYSYCRDLHLCENGLGCRFSDWEITKLSKVKIETLNFRGTASELGRYVGILSEEDIIDTIEVEVPSFQHFFQYASHYKYTETLIVKTDKENDWIPAEIQLFEKIDWLCLCVGEKGSIADIHSNVSKLPNLERLILNKCKLGRIPLIVADLHNIVGLDISDNPIKEIPRFMYDLKNLRCLIMEDTMIPENEILNFNNYLKKKFPNEDLKKYRF